MKPEQLEFLARLVRARSGVLLRGDQAYFAESRLAPLARREGAASVQALIAQVSTDREERLVQAVVESMTVSDTAFFREREVFDHIGSLILPDLLKARPDGVVRAWCAGCSTGQEAYSLAMLAEQVRVDLPALKLDIVGTDLSQRALEKAHSGVYTQFEVQRGLPIRMLLQHFDKIGEMWRVRESLRGALRWRQLNLLQGHRSVRPFDLILCRNVTGYFAPETRTQVLEQMASALSPDGYLVLGLGETAEAPSLQPANDGLRTFRLGEVAGCVAA